MTKEQLQEQINSLQQLTTLLNTTSADIFQRLRDVEQKEDQLDNIKLRIRAEVLAKSMQEEFKKELSNAEKRDMKIQEMLDSNETARLLYNDVFQERQKIKILQQQFETYERKYKTAHTISKLLIAMGGHND